MRTRATAAYRVRGTPLGDRDLAYTRATTDSSPTSPMVEDGRVGYHAPLLDTIRASVARHAISLGASTLSKSLAVKPTAGVLGYGGQDELHIVVSVDGRSDAHTTASVFDTAQARRICILKREVEKAPGFAAACEKRAGLVRMHMHM